MTATATDNPKVCDRCTFTVGVHGFMTSEIVCTKCGTHFIKAYDALWCKYEKLLGEVAVAPDVSAPKKAVFGTLGDAKRCYDLYLWAFATARSGGVVNVSYSEEEENEAGCDLVLLHRRAILLGVIHGAEQDGCDYSTTPFNTIRRISEPLSPGEFWERIALEEDAWEGLAVTEPAAPTEAGDAGEGT